MKTIKIIRRNAHTGDQFTKGDLFVDNTGIGYTLEPKVRQEKYGEFDPERKVYGQTAIPFGTYDGFIRYSEKWGRKVIQLTGVPYFSAIQIHPGNFLRDTDGCILPGLTYSDVETAVWNSEIALDRILEEIGDNNFKIQIL